MEPRLKSAQHYAVTSTVRWNKYSLM